MNYLYELEKYDLVEQDCNYYRTMYNVIPRGRMLIERHRVAAIEADTAEITFHNPHNNDFKPEFLTELSDIAKFLYKEYHGKEYEPVCHPVIS